MIVLYLKISTAHSTHSKQHKSLTTEADIFTEEVLPHSSSTCLQCMKPLQDRFSNQRWSIQYAVSLKSKTIDTNATNSLLLCCKDYSQITQNPFKSFQKIVKQIFLLPRLLLKPEYMKFSMIYEDSQK